MFGFQLLQFIHGQGRGPAPNRFPTIHGGVARADGDYALYGDLLLLVFALMCQPLLGILVDLVLTLSLCDLA